jgi:hypothetical protein
LSLSAIRPAILKAQQTLEVVELLHFLSGDTAVSVMSIITLLRLSHSLQSAKSVTS